ncbi:major tail sheath protein [Serratia sp. M24T3]|nr:major tail sheath protein [Serratia sp. M24T3]
MPALPLPYSARAADLRARIDLDRGWWWSKSNQDIFSILGVEHVDDFILGEPNCQANLLNMENISTIIRRDGFKHWGNRLCTRDPRGNQSMAECAVTVDIAISYYKQSLEGVELIEIDTERFIRRVNGVDQLAMLAAKVRL